MAVNKANVGKSKQPFYEHGLRENHPSWSSRRVRREAEAMLRREQKRQWKEQVRNGGL